MKNVLPSDFPDQARGRSLPEMALYALLGPEGVAYLVIGESVERVQYIAMKRGLSNRERENTASSSPRAGRTPRRSMRVVGSGTSTKDELQQVAKKFDLTRDWNEVIDHTALDQT